jgi:hypothetical protein
LKRIVLVLAMVAVMVAMLCTPALASSARYDCYKKDRSRLDVSKNKAQTLVDRGYACYRTSSAL